MKKEIETVNAGAGQSPVDDNLSPLSFQQLRAQQLTSQEDEKNIPSDPVSEESSDANENTLESNLDSSAETETKVEAHTEDKELEDDVPSDDVLSKIDLDNMSEDELRELADKLRSRAVSRYGQLTAQRKQAQEETEYYKSLLNKQENNPFKIEDDHSKNPYSSEWDVGSLRKSFNEVSGIIEWAEDVLFHSDHNSPDDVVTTVDGKDLTKTEVRSTLINAKKARDKYLPAQYNRVEQKSKVQALEADLNQRALSELKWMSDDSDPLKSKYNEMLSDPRIDELKDKSPDLGAMLPYLLSHAVNSIFGGSKKTEQAPVKPQRINPPSSPNASVVNSDKSLDKTAASIREMQSLFEKSGSQKDFIKLRSLQMQLNNK